MAGHARVLALDYQLNHTQWWPFKDLQRHQRDQLERMVRHAAAMVPFYRDGFANLIGDTTDDEWWRSWRDLPIITRAKIQQAGDSLACRNLPPGHGDVEELRTSGSTGSPVSIQSTDVAQLFQLAVNLRRLRWHGFDFRAKAAAIRVMPTGQAMPPEGQRQESWAPAYSTGPLAILNSVGTTVRQHLDWLQTEKPVYLLTYPTLVDAIVRHAERENVVLPFLRGIATFGESLEPGLHEACERVLGVPLFDAYSAVEVGTIATQCPDYCHYHIDAECALVEIVDDSGRACGPGNVGRVVVTPLHNFATPLLRYDVGDYAEVGEPCSCGRGLPVLSRIMGRRRNLLTLPNGDRMWPSFGTRSFPEIAPILQHQFIQRSPEHIEARLVTGRPLTSAEEEDLRAHLLKRLGHPFRFTFTYLDEFPLSTSGKFETFVSEVDT